MDTEKPSPTKLSVVIPAFNESALIADCIKSIKQAFQGLQNPAWQPRIIVCDNNSSDGTSEVAAHSGAEVIFEPHNQISRARNKGASGVRSEWILFVDADSRVSQRLARETVTLMTSEHVAGGGAVIAMETQNRMAVFLVGLWNRLSRLTQTAAGSYLFCRTADFKAVGGFSEDLYASEELNLTKKIKKLTKSRGQSFRIITSSPIHTSARKFGLYSKTEQLRFFIGGLLSPIKMPRDKDACFIWYDGRR